MKFVAFLFTLNLECWHSRFRTGASGMDGLSLRRRLGGVVQRYVPVITIAAGLPNCFCCYFLHGADVRASTAAARRASRHDADVRAAAAHSASSARTRGSNGLAATLQRRVPAARRADEARDDSLRVWVEANSASVSILTLPCRSPRVRSGRQRRGAEGLALLWVGARSRGMPIRGCPCMSPARQTLHALIRSDQHAAQLSGLTVNLAGVRRHRFRQLWVLARVSRYPQAGDAAAR